MTDQMQYENEWYDILGVIDIHHRQYVIIGNLSIPSFYYLEVLHQNEKITYRKISKNPRYQTNETRSRWLIEQYLLDIYLKKLIYHSRLGTSFSLDVLRQEVDFFQMFLKESENMKELFKKKIMNEEDLDEEIGSLRELMKKYKLHFIEREMKRILTEKNNQEEKKNLSVPMKQVLVEENKRERLFSEKFVHAQETIQNYYHHSQSLMKEILPAVILSCITGTIGLTSLLFIIVNI